MYICIYRASGTTAVAILQENSPHFLRNASALGSSSHIRNLPPNIEKSIYLPASIFIRADVRAERGENGVIC